MEANGPTPERVLEIGQGFWVAKALLSAVELGVFTELDRQSVAVTGPVRAVSNDGEEWDHFMRTLDQNGWFVRSFERADDVEAIHGWELRIDELRWLEREEEISTSASPCRAKRTAVRRGVGGARRVTLRSALVPAGRVGSDGCPGRPSERNTESLQSPQR